MTTHRIAVPTVIGLVAFVVEAESSDDATMLVQSYCREQGIVLATHREHGGEVIDTIDLRARRAA